MHCVDVQCTLQTLIGYLRYTVTNYNEIIAKNNFFFFLETATAISLCLWKVLLKNAEIGCAFYSFLTG